MRLNYTINDKKDKRKTTVHIHSTRDPLNMIMMTCSLQFSPLFFVSVVAIRRV